MLDHYERYQPIEPESSRIVTHPIVGIMLSLLANKSSPSLLSLSSPPLSRCWWIGPCIEKLSAYEKNVIRTFQTPIFMCSTRRTVGATKVFAVNPFLTFSSVNTSSGWL